MSWRGSVLCFGLPGKAKRWIVGCRALQLRIERKGGAHACSRSFTFNSYLTRIFVCSIVVRRDIISVLDAGKGSSVGIGSDGVAVIAVGELGAEPGVACRLSEERVFNMFVAFLSVVRKSSAIEIVRGCKKDPWRCPDLCEANHPFVNVPVA